MGEAVGSICCRSACGCRLNADCEEPWKMMGVRLVAALASATVLAVSCASPASPTNPPAGDAWPMYRGDLARDGHPRAATLDAAGAARLTLAWHAHLTGAIDGSPHDGHRRQRRLQSGMHDACVSQWGAGRYRGQSSFHLRPNPKRRPLPTRPGDADLLLPEL